jgi:hypothetical protein
MAPVRGTPMIWPIKDARLSWSVLVKTRQDKRHQDQASAWSCLNRLGLLRTLLQLNLLSDPMQTCLRPPTVCPQVLVLLKARKGQLHTRRKRLFQRMSPLGKLGAIASLISDLSLFRYSRDSREIFPGVPVCRQRDSGKIFPGVLVSRQTGLQESQAQLLQLFAT